MKYIILTLYSCLFLSVNALAIESFDGFLISAYDDRYRIVSPEKFKSSMEIVVENKTLSRLIGKVLLNHKKNVAFLSIEPEKYKKINISLKKEDILHFYPLSPAFQEVELIVGNKTYEIPQKK